MVTETRTGAVLSRRIGDTAPMEEERAKVAGWWRNFADTQCRGYSPLYERICHAVAENDEVIDLVREAPFFGMRERAALALAEALTDLGQGPLPDEVWDAAAAAMTDEDLTALVVTVVAIKLVGIVLIAAFLVMPAACARLFARTFAQMGVLALLISAATLIVGLFASYYADLPSGPAIILTQALLLGFGLRRLRALPERGRHLLRRSAQRSVRRRLFDRRRLSVSAAVSMRVGQPCFRPSRSATTYRLFRSIGETAKLRRARWSVSLKPLRPKTALRQNIGSAKNS